MSRRHNSPFSSIQTEGGLLPQDLLSRIQSGDKTLDGVKPESYHLAPHERVGEAVNRAWSRLTVLWHGFQEALASQSDTGLATGLTRDRWLLPLFQELGYGRLPKGQAIEADGKRFAVTHSWQHSPIHLLGVGVDLDRRQAGVAGAAKASPHGLVQEFLNRSDNHRWGFVSNGLRLRILRDHHSLTRQAYVEFDLQAIMDGEQYSEFLLLWMVCHQSRVEADNPADCWLEQWFNTARQEGVRALDKLRAGVEQAIAAFGTGFLTHRGNTRLHNALASGELDKQEYYRQVLRLVYRLIFLFVAEGRDALLDPRADAAARDRYLRFYATGRLRELADKRRGGTHGDLWQGLRLVMSKLHDGCPELALPALGSALWGPAGCPWLMEAECGNEHVLDAVRRLSNIQDGKTRYPVNWRNVGADELGSIYEGLLELHPRINKEAGTFELDTAAGHERKNTGSYYTPTELVDCLLDSALDPVVDDACRKPNPEAAILNLMVCDPACGSGHFLVAAARRIAKRLAGVRAGENEPSPSEVQRALRDVVGRCIYGVDINPMAVELCKVSLWMEAIEPGLPLSFLDSHIQCGNALLGTTPALMARGIPNDAFKPIEGDDREVAKRLKKRNAAERKSKQLGLALPAPLDAPVVREFMACDRSADFDLAAVREHESCWLNLQQSQAYRDAQFRADAWCAAFVWPKEPRELGSAAITQEVWRQLQRDASTASSVMRETVWDLARQYRFFHWHLAFPQVFGNALDRFAENEIAGWEGGFDLLIGNPPWDEVQFEETAWFAGREAGVAKAATAAERGRRIEELRESNSTLYNQYCREVRLVDGVKACARNSGLYPHGARGKLNTYVLFVEQSVRLIARAGFVGWVVPTGIATDKSTARLYEAIAAAGRIRSLFDFVNERGLFPDVRPHQHFCLLTIGAAQGPEAPARYAAFLCESTELADPGRIYELPWSSIQRLSQGLEVGVLSLFGSAHHASVFEKLVAAFPPLGSQTGDGQWHAEYQQGTFNMASASEWFRTEENLRGEGYVIQPLVARGRKTYVPLFDAKMARQYSWQAASLGFSGHQFRKVSKETTSLAQLLDPSFIPRPAYWVPAGEANGRFNDWQHPWLLGFKDVTGVTSTRLAVFAIIPRLGVGHPFPLLRVRKSAIDHAVMLSWMNTILVEFFLRQRMHGLHLTWHLLSQVPAPARSDIMRAKCPWYGEQSTSFWLAARVGELSVTSWAITSFSEALGIGSSPYRYDAERRNLLQCEIDAAWMVLAGFGRPDVEFVFDALPKVQSADVRSYGDYRTKLLVLDIYDRLRQAMDRGKPYQTLLDPPPADPRVAHPESTRPDWAKGDS